MDAKARPSRFFLLLLWAVTAALVVTGYRGGENVYRFGVGVAHAAALEGLRHRRLTVMSLNAAELERFVNGVWDQSIVAELCEYVRIPNKSPLFDPDWERHGHMERAVALMADWASRQPMAGMRLRIARLPGRTPLIFMEVPGQTPETVLFYGHLDKQPEFTGWQQGLGPWEPVIRDGRLYGRGAADDGYAIFSSLTAIAALQAQKIPHARCVLLIEACEESGSVDLPAHVDALAADIGSPSLVVCLDAEAGDYERLWLTTSLRGNIVGTLEIDVLTEGVHSGAGSGIAASCVDVAAHSVVATIRFRDGRAQARRAQGRSARG